MYLYTKLQNLNKPISIAFIGCGKFVSMFLAQYNQLNKIILDTIVELDIDRAKKNCSNSGLSNETIDKIKNKPATEIESKFGLTKFLNREYLEVLTNYSFKQ